MNSTLTNVLKAGRLSVGSLQLHTLSDDDIIKLMDGTKANIAILIFIVIWMIKLLTKTFLRFRKAVNRHSETQSPTPATMERGEEDDPQ